MALVTGEGMAPGATRLVAQAHGRVQGVSFRDFVAFHARRLGVTGYVRNLPSGTAVEVDWQPAQGEFSSFRARY